MIKKTSLAHIRRKDMMELWKETFHDSDRYIQLVFDTYYSNENSFVRYHENRIIAAMLTVPYEFQILTKEGKKEQFRGLYLCGLATHPEWRRRGIMSGLMMEAEEVARDRGYDLAFLIPADENLREYYRRHGYSTSSWRTRETIVCGDNHKENESEILNIYSVKDFIGNGKSDFINRLAEWCQKIELSRCHDTILHSHKDMLTIMAENENSIFLTDGSFVPENPILAKVLAVAFPQLPEKPDQPIIIVDLYVEERPQEEFPYSLQEKSNVKELADAIGNAFSEKCNFKDLQILKSLHSRPEERRGAESYAMLKPLSERANLLQKENPTIEISLMLD